MLVTNKMASLFKKHVLEEKLSPYDALCHMKEEMPGQSIPCLSTWYRHVNAGDVGVRHGETPYHPNRKPKGPRPHPAMTVPDRLVLVDRKSRCHVIEKLEHVTQDGVVKALKRTIRRKALGKARSVTTDNGCEFLDPKRIKAAVGCDVYCTRAKSSWEKGSVENCNRFVRRWYPKGTDFGKCTRADMHRLERVINSIHRKLLGGLTAYEYDTAYARAA